MDWYKAEEGRAIEAHEDPGMKSTALRYPTWYQDLNSDGHLLLNAGSGMC